MTSSEVLENPPWVRTQTPGQRLHECWPLHSQRGTFLSNKVGGVGMGGQLKLFKERKSPEKGLKENTPQYWQNISK